MPRADLRGLIGNLGESQPVLPEPAKPVESNELASAVETTAPVVHEHAEKPRTTARSAPPVAVGKPLPTAHFLDFERKETRLRADQQNALTELARRLNRAKGVGGSRITDNTLIRVAIDLLLSKASSLGGRDEAALRHSVGVKADKS